MEIRIEKTKRKTHVLLKTIKVPDFSKEERKKILKSLSHGSWCTKKLKGATVYAICSFCKKCLSTVNLKYFPQLNQVDVYINDKCNGQPTKKLHVNFENDIIELIKTGTKPDKIHKILEQKLDLSKEQIYKHIQRLRRNLVKKSLNLNIRNDRQIFCCKYNFKGVENAIPLAIMSTESHGNNVDQKNYDCICYTSVKLCENIRNVMKNEKILLNLDGTYKILSNRKQKPSQAQLQPWVHISLGTTGVEWNEDKQVYSTKYFPFMFMISKSESTNAVKALFQSFINLCKKIDENFESNRITMVCSDGAAGFTNAVLDTFKNARHINDWPHISRKPYERYAPKKSLIAEYLNISLCMLRTARTEKEFLAFYEYIKEFFKREKIPPSYVNKIEYLCNNTNFRYNSSIPGMCDNTQALERFNRTINDMPRMKGSADKHFLSIGIYQLLENVEKNPNHISKQICYEGKNNYEKRMLLEANSLIFQCHVNIKMVTNHLKDDAKKRKQNQDSIRNILRNICQHDDYLKEDIFIIPEEFKKLSMNLANQLQNERIIISDKNYFKENTNAWYISSIEGYIPVMTKNNEQFRHISGFNLFLDKKCEITVKSCYLFRIESRNDGDDYDPGALYAISEEDSMKFLLESPQSKKFLDKIKLNYSDISDLSSYQLRLVLKEKFKQKGKKKRKIEELTNDEDNQDDVDDEIYLMNTPEFLGIEIDNDRIIESNESLKGNLHTENYNDINFLRRKFSFHTIRIKKNKEIICDCLNYFQIKMCAHILAVKDCIHNEININQLLTGGCSEICDEKTKFLGKKIKKYFKKNPVTQICGTFTGIISKYCFINDELLYKVNFRTHSEFMQTNEILKYIKI